MAVYNCECGLIISTSSERPRCLRCLRVLGPQDVADRASQPLADQCSHLAPRDEFPLAKRDEYTVSADRTAIDAGRICR
jgi:hypothetical protein